MLTVLAFLDRFGYATVWQVVRATGRSPKAVCRTLDLLKVGGLAQQHVDVPCPGRPAAWSATAAGLAAVGSRRRALPSAPLHRRHSLALVDLAFALEAEYGGRWEAERELDSDIGPQWGNDCIACPDGRLTLPDGQRILIQLQLSQGKVNDQYRHAWRQRARGLGREVWFYCTRDTAPRYRRALKAGDATFIRVLEWKPPDHSGGVREVDATWQRRRARTKTAAGRAVGASANR